MEGILKRVQSEDVAQRCTVKLDGPEIGVVRSHLDMGESEKDSTILSAARILGNCSNPHGKPMRKVGLAIGKVQSGKTSNYISLTALISVLVNFDAKSQICCELLQFSFRSLTSYFSINCSKSSGFAPFHS